MPEDEYMWIIEIGGSDSKTGGPHTNEDDAIKEAESELADCYDYSEVINVYIVKIIKKLEPKIILQEPEN